jgi:putative transposase
MKQGKFSEAQIINILGSQGKDKSVENLCREHGISPATFYNWKSKYGGLGSEELKRMKERSAAAVRIRKCSSEKVIGR